MGFYKGTILVLLVLGVAISSIVMDARAVFVCAAVLVLLQTVCGVIAFPKLSSTFAIELPFQETLSDEPPVVLDGQEFRLGPWRKVLVGFVKPANISVLLADCAAAVFAIYVVAAGRYSSTALENIFTLEAVTAVAATALVTSATWFEECYLLRNCAVCMGMILFRTSGKIRDQITFNFFDQQGERRGGTAPAPHDRPECPRDNAVVILYLPENPDRNAAAHALRFHHVGVAFVPAAKLVESAQQSS